MSFLLHFDRLGRNGRNIDIKVRNLSEKEINPKIQKHLMSRDWEYEINLDKGCGYLWVGSGSLDFTVKEVADE